MNRHAGESPARGSVSLRPRRVLWIDDEIQKGDAIVQLLEGNGLLVEIASSGSEGLTLAEGAEFDAIVLDLKLDDMYGLTVLRRLRAAGVRTPVLVVTGYYGEPEAEADALDAGAVAFKRKPLDSWDLACILREFIYKAEHTYVLGSGFVRACSNPFKSTAVRGVVDPRLADVLQILREEIGVPHSLQSLGDRVGLGPSRLRHLFTSALQTPLVRFRKNLRLDTAADLLVRTHDRISDVARKVGMDAVYFEKAFHRRFGVAPRAYRARHRH